MKNTTNRKFDYTLYLVTDRKLMCTETLCETVEQGILGGCTMVQLREKNISSLDFYNLTKEVKEITDRYHIPLIINDRIDIALSVKAAGVHIGQSDLPAAVARRIVGQDMLLGVSASSVQEAVKAQADGADYLGVGAMHRTDTKIDAKIVYMSELEHIRQAVHIPIVVIGGIDKENAADFSGMGIDGLAIVSAIISQKDVQGAAKDLKKRFRRE